MFWPAELSGRPRTHRPAFIGLLVIGAVVGVAVGGVLALVTSSAGYPEWTLILFQFIALAAIAVLPVGLESCCTHATWRFITSKQAGATPEELQLASQLVLPVGSGAIAAWVVLVLADGSTPVTLAIPLTH